MSEFRRSLQATGKLRAYRREQGTDGQMLALKRTNQRTGSPPPHALEGLDSQNWREIIGQRIND
jgi:hypothetical protein